MMLSFKKFKSSVVIVFVDDTESNLFVIDQLLSNTGWDLKFYSNPSDALQNILSLAPAIVISDYQMDPDMNGLQFLNKVRDIYPDAIRIILSSWPHKEVFQKEVENGLLFSFWEKHNDVLNIKEKLIQVHQFYIKSQNKRSRSDKKP